MRGSFVHTEKPVLTVMLKQTETPEDCIAEIRRGLAAGAEGFGLQMENLPRKYHRPEIVKDIFAAMEGKPLYVTNYKLVNNTDLPYEALAEELISFAEYGAALCDFTGDCFARHPFELTEDMAAIQKQMALAEAIRKAGGEVCISSHVNQYRTGDAVLQIAREHRRRGADVSKIVTHGNSMAEQLENLRTTAKLKEELGIPFLFLSGGVCRLHRNLGILLGCCMSLCVCEKTDWSLHPQPLITEQRAVRDSLELGKE